MSNEELEYEDAEINDHAVKSGAVDLLREAAKAQTEQRAQEAPASKTNFIIPPGMNPSTITLENYRQVTGHRFRMTKDQHEVRGLNRADAFVESKAVAVSKLEVN